CVPILISLTLSLPVFPYTTLFRSTCQGRCTRSCGSTSSCTCQGRYTRSCGSTSSCTCQCRCTRSCGSTSSCTCQGRYTRSCSSRSEEHTSELQSLAYFVCRLLLEK